MGNRNHKEQGSKYGPPGCHPQPCQRTPRQRVRSCLDSMPVGHPQTSMAHQCPHHPRMQYPPPSCPTCPPPLIPSCPINKPANAFCTTCPSCPMHSRMMPPCPIHMPPSCPPMPPHCPMSHSPCPMAPPTCPMGHVCSMMPPNQRQVSYSKEDDPCTCDPDSENDTNEQGAQAQSFLLNIDQGGKCRTLNITIPYSEGRDECTPVSFQMPNNDTTFTIDLGYGASAPVASSTMKQSDCSADVTKRDCPADGCCSQKVAFNMPQNGAMSHNAPSPYMEYQQMMPMPDMSSIPCNECLAMKTPPPQQQISMAPMCTECCHLNRKNLTDESKMRCNCFYPPSFGHMACAGMISGNCDCVEQNTVEKPTKKRQSRSSSTTSQSRKDSNAGNESRKGSKNEINIESRKGSKVEVRESVTARKESKISNKEMKK